jgi:hypothetical protein
MRSFIISSSLPEARLCFYCIVVSFGLPGVCLNLLLLSVPGCQKLSCIHKVNNIVIAQKAPNIFVVKYLVLYMKYSVINALVYNEWSYTV